MSEPNPPTNNSLADSEQSFGASAMELSKKHFPPKPQLSPDILTPPPIAPIIKRSDKLAQQAARGIEQVEEDLKVDAKAGAKSLSTTAVNSGKSRADDESAQELHAYVGRTKANYPKVQAVMDQIKKSTFQAEQSGRESVDVNAIVNEGSFLDGLELSFLEEPSSTQT